MTIASGPAASSDPPDLVVVQGPEKNTYERGESFTIVVKNKDSRRYEGSLSVVSGIQAFESVEMDIHPGESTEIVVDIPKTIDDGHHVLNLQTPFSSDFEKVGKIRVSGGPEPKMLSEENSSPMATSFGPSILSTGLAGIGLSSLLLVIGSIIAGTRYRSLLSDSWESTTASSAAIAIIAVGISLRDSMAATFFGLTLFEICLLSGFFATIGWSSKSEQTSIQQLFALAIPVSLLLAILIFPLLLGDEWRSVYVVSLLAACPFVLLLGSFSIAYALKTYKNKPTKLPKVVITWPLGLSASVLLLSLIGLIKSPAVASLLVLLLLFSSLLIAVSYIVV